MPIYSGFRKYPSTHSSITRDNCTSINELAFGAQFNLQVGGARTEWHVRDSSLSRRGLHSLVSVVAFSRAMRIGQRASRKMGYRKLTSYWVLCVTVLCGVMEVF